MNPVAQVYDRHKVYEDELADLPIARLNVAQPGVFQCGLATRYLERLRREAPVHKCLDSAYGPYWSITRFGDIEAVELDHETFSSDHFNGGISIASHPNEPQFLPSFIAMDPPRHTERRRTVAPAFGPARTAALVPSIREWSAEILDALPVGEPFDWVDKVSVELTARTLALLLGFPQVRARELIRWSDAMVALPGGPEYPTLEEKLRVMRECFAAFDTLWEERLADPGDEDLLGLLCRSPGTRGMPRAELHGNIMLLIVGGNDTTRSTISASVVAFDRYPAELAKLRARSGLIGNLAPELMRWQTPVAHMRRTAMRDVTVGGCRIARGDKVVMWYLSGNRDENMFERADDFDIDRPNARRHLSFGAGVHRCIGARVAELQIQVLWEEILKRFPKIEVLGPPRRTCSTFLHGYTELEVVIPQRLPVIG